MHEFSSIKTVFDDLCKRPRDIKVRLGKMRCSKEVFRNTIDELLTGAGLDNLDIDIETVDVVGRCECGFTGKIDVPGHVHFIRCPKCGNICDAIKGNELEIYDM